MCRLPLFFTAHGITLNKPGQANARYVDCQHWAVCYAKIVAMIVCYRGRSGKFVEPAQLKLAHNMIYVPNATLTHRHSG